MINVYVKKRERCQINNITLHFKELETKEQTKLKVSRKKIITKISMEINEIETRKIKDQ